MPINPFHPISFIRFLSDDPHMSIWTADFTIDGMSGSSSSTNNRSSTQTENQSLQTTPTPSLAGNPTETNSAGDDGDGQVQNNVVTVTMEMSSTPSRSSTASASGTASNGGRATQVGAVSNDARGRSIRKTNLRFNIVFVLFPALLGLALSL